MQIYVKHVAHGCQIVILVLRITIVKFALQHTGYKMLQHARLVLTLVLHVLILRLVQEFVDLDQLYVIIPPYVTVKMGICNFCKNV